jgi:hypothetical protein
MLTWLRITVSCFCMVLCVSFAALWVRSYYHTDTLRSLYRENIAITKVRDHVISNYGSAKIYFRTGGNPVWKTAKWDLLSSDYPPKPQRQWFSWKRGSMGGARLNIVTIPYWFAVPSIALLATAIRPKPRWRFGLRELFVLSTIGAITIGTLAVVLRAISS